MTGQKKSHSFFESLFNVLVGYFVAVGSTVVIFPLFDIMIPLRDNFILGMWFTGISIIRSYVLRRWFNKLMLRYPVRSQNESTDSEPQAQELPSDDSIYGRTFGGIP
jgi:hypothetical protein